MASRLKKLASCVANAKKQGIAIIKQVGNTMVINDANLKVF
jgi:hypothetical protein